MQPSLRQRERNGQDGTRRQRNGAERQRDKTAHDQNANGTVRNANGTQHQRDKTRTLTERHGTRPAGHGAKRHGARPARHGAKRRETARNGRRAASSPKTFATLRLCKPGRTAPPGRIIQDRPTGRISCSKGRRPYQTSPHPLRSVHAIRTRMPEPRCRR